MTIAFRNLSKATQERIIKSLKLPKDKERLLMLRYVEEFSYARIAAEMNISQTFCRPYAH